MRQWETSAGLDRPAPPDDTSDEVLVDVALRLRHRIEHQAGVLERLNGARSRADELAALAELRRCTDGLRRVAEELLVLGGAGGEPAAPRPLAAVLTEAAASVTGGDRVRLGPVPHATVAGEGAADLARLLAELLERTLAAATGGSPVDVAARWSDDAGVAVEVTGDGPADDPAGPGGDPALELAARLGRRCRIGVTVHP
ncbi:MAG TPA: hypothetical protein VM367_15885, partial [Pseudonocardia sp.]|nr:hypothetical protein [Pseudonocardia sp.]